MANLSQKRREAMEELARRKQRKIKSDPAGPVEGAAESAASGFNLGLAKGAGTFVDLINLGLSPIGLSSDRPIGGSEQLTDLFERLGLVQQDPMYQPVSRIGEEIGAASVPFGATGGIARTGIRGAKYARPILEQFRSAPMANALAELSAGGGAGTGAAISEMIAPDNQTAEFMGQMIGGFANIPAIAMSAGNRGYSSAKRILEPFTPGGAKRQAANRIQRVVEDPEGVAARLGKTQGDEIPGAVLTPGQESGEPGLLALEKELAKRSPYLREQFEGMKSTTTRAMGQEAENIAGMPSGQTRDFLSSRVSQIEEMADSHAAKALLKARTQLDNIRPGTSQEEMSRIARDAVEDAFQKAKTQEREIWGAVDETATVDTKNLKQSYQEAKQQFKKFDEAVPEWVDAALKDETPMLKDTEKLGDVQSFRSKLQREIRSEQAKDAPNRRKIAVLDTLQEGALDAMSQSDAGDTLQDAIAYSRRLNERFSQGIIGKIRGYERRGGLSTAPEQTLDRIVKGGSEGGVNLERLVDAVGDDPQATQAVSDYLKQKFVQQVTDVDDMVKPEAAERFIRQNKEVLDRMPQTKKLLEQARDSQSATSRIVKRMSGRKASVLDKSKSRAALYLDAPIDREMKKVLNSKDPVNNMRQLARQAGKDKTGAALKGLKAQFIDEMMRQGRTKAVDMSGQPIYSGKNLSDFLGSNRKVARTLFSSDELERVNKIAKTAKKLESTTDSEKVKKILDEGSDQFTDLLSRVVGANLGAASGLSQASGSGLVMAHAGSEKMRHITNKLPFYRVNDVLTQAVLDKNLMRNLLLKAKTPKQAEALRRRLNSWIVNLAPEMEPTEGPEERPESVSQGKGGKNRTVAQ